MRVATYVQSGTTSRSSVLACAVCTFTILLGSSVVHTLVSVYVPTYIVGVSGLWILLYIVAFMALMIDQGVNWVSWLVRYRILLVLLLLGTALSIAWSISYLVSAERVIHLLGCSILAIYIGFMLPLLTVMRLLAVVLAALLLASVLAATSFPEVGIITYEGAEVWRGVFNSKNILGFWAAVGVLLYLSLIDTLHTFSERAMCLGMAVLSLGMLAMSQSATSVLALLIGGSLSFYLYIAMRFKLGFVRMVVLAALFIGLLSLGISNIDTASIVGRSDDLTGRAEVWRQTWSLIMERPLAGYGYGTIWFPTDETLYIQQALTDFTWVVYHAHNGFLQVASEIGLPLSCIALLMVAQQLIEIFHCQSQRRQVGVLFVLAFVVAYLVSNFSEARFLVNRELYWILFIALPISMLRQNTVQLANAEDPGQASRVRDEASNDVVDIGVHSPEAQPSAWPITATGIAATLVQHLDDGARLAYEEDLMRQFAAFDLYSAPDIDLGSATMGDDFGADYPFDEDVTLDISSLSSIRDEIDEAGERLRLRASLGDDDGFDPVDYGTSSSDGMRASTLPGLSDELIASFPLSEDDTTRHELELAQSLRDEMADHESWLEEASSDLQHRGAEQPAVTPAGEQHVTRRGSRTPGDRTLDDPTLGDLTDLDDTSDPGDYGVFHFDKPSRRGGSR